MTIKHSETFVKAWLEEMLHIWNVAGFSCLASFVRPGILLITSTTKLLWSLLLNLISFISHSQIASSVEPSTVQQTGRFSWGLRPSFDLMCVYSWHRTLWRKECTEHQLSSQTFTTMVRKKLKLHTCPEWTQSINALLCVCIRFFYQHMSWDARCQAGNVRKAEFNVSTILLWRSSAFRHLHVMKYRYLKLYYTLYWCCRYFVPVHAHKAMFNAFTHICFPVWHVVL